MVHHSRGWKVQDQGTASDEGFLTASEMTEVITWVRERERKRGLKIIIILSKTDS